jgi:tetratricopeptide (TPR) repeat protein
MDRLTMLMEMLQSDTESDFLLFAIAKEHEKDGNFEQAEKYYLTLMNTHPSYVGLYYHLGGLYKEYEQPEKAEEIYKKGIVIAEDIKDLHSLAELKTAYTNLYID